MSWITDTIERMEKMLEQHTERTGGIERRTEAVLTKMGKARAPYRPDPQEEIDKLKEKLRKKDQENNKLKNELADLVLLTDLADKKPEKPVK